MTKNIASTNWGPFTAVGTGGTYNSWQENGVSGDWLLSASNYVAAKMPMAITFPLNSLASADSYAKNAYTGVRWNIPIIIQGGAWPFKYEIVSNGGATGLTIGAELDRTIDGLTGRTLHKVGADYGVLSLPSPSAGAYSITVRVTDQELNTIDVPISLTVGTAKWLFVDPVGGNDSTGTGAIGAPFKTIGKIHGDSNLTTTYSGYRVYLRAGTTPLDGMATNNNNYNATGTNNPVQFIGYPGESVVLEAYEGWFNLSAADDFYLGDLTYQYAAAYSPGGGTVPIYMVNSFSGSDRSSYFNVDFKDFKGNPFNSGSGNTSILYIAGGGTLNTGVSHCSLSGQTGTFIDWYATDYSVVEHLDISNVTTGTDDGSSRAIMFLKDSPDHVTLRDCNIWDSISWTETNNYGGIGIYGQAGATNVEIAYCTLLAPFASGRAGAIYNWGNNSEAGLIENIYLYRNSVKERFYWEGGTSYTNFAAGEEVHESNVLDTGAMPSNVQISSSGNVDSATYFDASMLLTGASRTNYLGTKGAEVAE